MKNFETNCPIEGSSALQMDFEQTLLSSGNIISFPRSYPLEADEAHSSCFNKKKSQTESPIQWAASRISHTEMAQSLRYDSVQGCAYSRIKPWQAAVAGSVFSLLAFASLFLGL